jgi:hypothetical protein
MRRTWIAGAVVVLSIIGALSSGAPLTLRPPSAEAAPAQTTSAPIGDLSATASSGPAFDQDLGSTSGNIVTSLTITTPTAAASSTRVVVAVSYWTDEGVRVSSVTAGGAAATQDLQVVNSDGDDIYEQWSVPEPSGLAAGSQIVVNFDGPTGGGALAAAMSISGVDLTNGGGVAGTGSSNSQSGEDWTSGSASPVGGIVVGGAGNETATSTTATVTTGTKVDDLWNSASQQGLVTGYSVGATGIAGTFSTSSSATTGGVVAYAASGTAPPPPSPAAPLNTAPPTISGTPQQGDTLTASDGTWTGDTPMTFSCAWSDGTHGCSDTLSASDVGQNITVTVTATNDAGSAGATSTPVGPVTAASSGGGTTETLTHDPSFVGPSYYDQFANTSKLQSMNFFPIGIWEEDLSNPVLASLTTGMGVNFLDEEYSGGCETELDAVAANNMVEQVNPSHSYDPCPGTNDCNGQDTYSTPLACFSGDSNVGDIFGYTLFDEPNEGTSWGINNCPNTPPIASDPAQDTCAESAIQDAAEITAGDPTRTTYGDETKSIFPWEETAPAAWNSANCGTGTNVPLPNGGTTNWSGCFEKHESMLFSAISLGASDIFGWTDPYEIQDNDVASTADQGQDTCTTGEQTHCGAWVDAYAVDRIKYYNSGIPGMVMLSMTRSADGSAVDTPPMIDADIWDSIAHAARGIIWWAADDAASAPVDPVSGSDCDQSDDGVCDIYWQANYNEAAADDKAVESIADELNSPTVEGVSASDSQGVPVATLGKDVNSSGKLWILATADGDDTHQMSNTTPMTVTITVPDTVPVGTVFNVVGENRTVTVDANHQFTDTFGTTTIDSGTDWPSGVSLTIGYQHHIYSQP